MKTSISVPVFAGVCALLVVQLQAAVIKPTAMVVTDAPGGDASTGTSSDPFVDDACVTSITFPGGTYTNSSGDYALPQWLTVVDGRSAVNAEFGDLDDNADGDDNPFAKAGYPAADRETTDPTIQDASITEAFSCTSIVEGVDGEGADYTFKTVFEQGISDNSSSSDTAPEVVFFERGVNSSVSVRAITGGTWDNPTYAGTTVSVGSGDWWASGYYTNTVEIDSAQQIGGIGIDLNDFGITSGSIYGLEITSTGNTGADLHAFFFTALNPSTQFSDVPVALRIPEPSTALCLLFCLGGACVRRHRRPSRR